LERLNIALPDEALLMLLEEVCRDAARHKHALTAEDVQQLVANLNAQRAGGFKPALTAAEAGVRCTSGPGRAPHCWPQP